MFETLVFHNTTKPQIIDLSIKKKIILFKIVFFLLFIYFFYIYKCYEIAMPCFMASHPSLSPSRTTLWQKYTIGTSEHFPHSELCGYILNISEG